MKPKTVWLSFNRYRPNKAKGERDLNTYTAVFEKLEYATRRDAVFSTKDFIAMGVGVDDPGEWDRASLLARMEGAIAYEFTADDPADKDPRKDRKGWAEYFKFAIPRDLSEEQQREYVYAWAEAVGKGRAVFVGGIHRDTPDNPHCHVLVMDRLESEHMAKKRAALRANGGKERARRKFVCQFSERGTMERMRNIYRDAANAYLERVGCLVRVETMSYERLGIDKKPQVHEGSSRKMKERGKVIPAREGELTRPDYNAKITELNGLIEEAQAMRAEAARVVPMLIEDARQANLRADDALARAVLADRVAAAAVEARQQAEREALASAKRAKEAERDANDCEREANEERSRAAFAAKAKEEAERQAREDRRRAEEAERRRHEEEEARAEMARQVQGWLRTLRETEAQVNEERDRREAERKLEAERLHRLIAEKQAVEKAKGEADRALVAMAQRLADEQAAREKERKAAENIITRTVHVALMAIALVEVHWKNLAAKLKALLPIKVEKPTNNGAGGYVLPADFGQKIAPVHQDAEHARAEAIRMRNTKSGMPGVPEIVKLYQLTPDGRPLTRGEVLAIIDPPPANAGAYQPYFPNPQGEYEQRQRERAKERERGHSR
ncbi:MobA/MobL family protein [Roseomonas genomospecies 6]|uniref:MobA/MobL protein domain-containing protein n=1 Tax=Roseomonas genomospecies 6 TaxID=214106 RepID=A0A9W7KMW7_9PROT|nr:MobA/MobL family protein [Roseomonas genomospecies 6]KAA0675836.1 hypothetical protein DS843_29860 [Roseomonas genomospecies 6]